MKPTQDEPVAAADDPKPPTHPSLDSISRRDFLAGAAAVGATLVLPGPLAAAAPGRKTFTILHTNDMHSSFIGMGPAADYSPFTIGDDTTRGGYARLAGLIAKRREARKAQGPVLVVDAGDFSMGTPFRAASRETGGELTVESYRLHPVDDSVAGVRVIAGEIDKLKQRVTGAVFASRGYSIDQPLAIAPRNLPNMFTDIAASTLPANL